MDVKQFACVCAGSITGSFDALHALGLSVGPRGTGAAVTISTLAQALAAAAAAAEAIASGKVGDSEPDPQAGRVLKEHVATLRSISDNLKEISGSSRRPSGALPGDDSGEHQPNDHAQGRGGRDRRGEEGRSGRESEEMSEGPWEPQSGWRRCGPAGEGQSQHVAGEAFSHRLNPNELTVKVGPELSHSGIVREGAQSIRLVPETANVRPVAEGQSPRPTTEAWNLRFGGHVSDFRHSAECMSAVNREGASPRYPGEGRLGGDASSLHLHKSDSAILAPSARRPSDNHQSLSRDASGPPVIQVWRVLACCFL